jgi:hypothetical protein
VTGLATIRTSLEQCYDAIESLAARMDATQWHAQSLCPDWDMRGRDHPSRDDGTGDDRLAAQSQQDDRPPLDRIGPYHDEMAALDDAAFAARIGEIFASRRADLAALTEADLARPSWTPIGPRSYGGFLEMRIFDFWVHERDISHAARLADRRHRAARGDRPRPGGGLDRLHRRQEDRVAGRRQHRVPPHRAGHARPGGRGRRPGQGGGPRRAPGRGTDDRHGDLHPAGSGPDRPATADRRRPRDLDRERRAGRTRRAQPEVHHLTARPATSRDRRRDPSKASAPVHGVGERNPPVHPG